MAAIHLRRRGLLSMTRRMTRPTEPTLEVLSLGLQLRHGRTLRERLLQRRTRLVHPRVYRLEHLRTRARGDTPQQPRRPLLRA